MDVIFRNQQTGFAKVEEPKHKAENLLKSAGHLAPVRQSSSGVVSVAEPKLARQNIGKFLKPASVNVRSLF